MKYKCFGSMRHFFKEHSLVHCRCPIWAFTDSNLNIIQIAWIVGVRVGCKKQLNSFKRKDFIQSSVTTCILDVYYKHNVSQIS